MNSARIGVLSAVATLVITGIAGGAGTAGAAAIVAVPKPYTDLPDRTIGKVFFTTSDNKSGTCTGVVVSSVNRDMVLTGGRCVALNMHFHKNVSFVPAYGSAGANSRPYGTWTARTLSTKTNWINNGDLHSDFGFIVLNKLNNKHIVDVVGAQGIAFNKPASQNYSVFGYTASNGGASQGRCNAPLMGRGVLPGTGPNSLHVSCDLSQPPATGGPWLISLSSAGQGFAVSVSSYRGSNTDKTVYGPYFDAAAKQLYDFTKTL